MGTKNSRMTPPRFMIAVQALAGLAQSGCVLSSSSMACRVNSHATFLRRVMIPLVQHGIVEAREGREGGYVLKIPPDRLTLAEIYLAVTEEDGTCQEKTEPSECETSGKSLVSALEDILSQAEEQFIACLRRYTLADFMEKAEIHR